MDFSDPNTWTIISIIVAWLCFRLSAYSERRGLIKSLESELQIHGWWMNGSYIKDEKENPRWKDHSYLVYRLATVAIDNAICRGPELFLNKELLSNITKYRQMVERFNQLIDSATTFQSNAELWMTRDTNETTELRSWMYTLTRNIHIDGIGSESKENQFGHHYYNLVIKQLSEEKNTKLVPVVWLITNINVYIIRKLFRYI